MPSINRKSIIALMKVIFCLFIDWTSQQLLARLNIAFNFLSLLSTDVFRKRNYKIILQYQNKHNSIKKKENF